ncbi:hypothetical protein QHF89_21210 [Polyangium sorediatum]|nr:hypothetical protein [Polyangium fumosum]MDI1432030.1 hypothetical protein [Polyangium sorediatum]
MARPLLEREAMIEDPHKSEMGGAHLNGHAKGAARVVRQVKRADDKLVAFVEERPLVALGVALAFGYVLGRVMTRQG